MADQLKGVKPIKKAKENKVVNKDIPDHEFIEESLGDGD
jgi:hypothetical protein